MFYELREYADGITSTGNKTILHTVVVLQLLQEEMRIT